MGVGRAMPCCPKREDHRRMERTPSPVCDALRRPTAQPPAVQIHSGRRVRSKARRFEDASAQRGTELRPQGTTATARQVAVARRHRSMAEAEFLALRYG